MKYAAYSQYSPSASIWLDRLPSHWQQLRVKHVIDRMESGVSVNAEASPAQPGEVGVLKTSCVYGDQFQPSENKRVLEDELDRVACRVKADRLVISRMNTPDLVGSCGYVPQDYPDLYLPDRLWQTFFNPARRCLPRYAWYYLTSRPAKSAISSLAAGTSGSMQNIAQEAFMGISFPLPPLDEQRSIVRFLDAKTAQIDALIAKKRQLIEKLKEKRQALIARTVTHGLPPEAAKAAGLEPSPETKDAGVEWLDRLPTHWQILPMTKYLSEMSDYRGKTPEKTDEGVFLVTARNVRMGFIDYQCSQEFVAVDEYDEIMRRGLPKVGDILFTTEAPLGNVALVDREDIALAQRIIRFRMRKNDFQSRFALYAMLADYFQSQLKSLSTGSTAEGLKASKLSVLRLIAPPVREQHAIAAFLDAECDQIDGLIDTTTSATDKLQEYRQSLITAAVSGQIDVREPA